MKMKQNVIRATPYSTFSMHSSINFRFFSVFHLDFIKHATHLLANIQTSKLNLSCNLNRTKFCEGEQNKQQSNDWEVWRAIVLQFQSLDIVWQEHVKVTNSLSAVGHTNSFEIDGKIYLEYAVRFLFRLKFLVICIFHSPECGWTEKICPKMKAVDFCIATFSCLNIIYCNFSIIYHRNNMKITRRHCIFYKCTQFLARETKEHRKRADQMHIFNNTIRNVHTPTVSTS